MIQRSLKRLGDRGFTLVEILIALAISSLAMTAIYATYMNQQKTYVVESQVAVMQQNLRAAMYYMERELRMAGCDPSGDAGAGIVIATNSTIQFTMDITGGETDGKDNDGDENIDEATEDIYSDGDVSDTDEDITYAVTDGDSDGDTDLVRTANGDSNIIAEDIDALDIEYLDKDSTVLAQPVADLSDIRAVQITVLARATQEDPDHSNTNEYKNQQGDTILTANDGFRRVQLSTHIKCRNLGI